MKNEKHQQAKNLYFQTNLSKTEIANRLGISRRTVMLWCQQGNWERLRQSAEHMPAMVAEKCYFLLDHYATHLLSSNAVISTFGPREANAINQMATSIKKLKNRSAINEAMEMFNFFLEYCKKQDPEIVDIISPLIEGYIATRRDTNVDAFVPAGFTRDGHMDEKQREQQIIESWKDEDDQLLMEEEYFAFLKHHEEQKARRNRTDDNADPTGSVIPNPPKAPRPTPAEPIIPAEEKAHNEVLGDRARTMTADFSTIVEESAALTPTLTPDLSEPRRTMTAEPGTIANKIDRNNDESHNEILGGHHRTMTAEGSHPELVERAEVNTATENDNFIMRWPDIHTPPFGYPPYTTEANMNYYHPLLTERFGIPRKTTAQHTCHPELVEGHPELAEEHNELVDVLDEPNDQYIECHGEPRRTMTVENRTYAEASTTSFALTDTGLVDVLDEPNETPSQYMVLSVPRRTMIAHDSTPAEANALSPSLSRDTLNTEVTALTPLQTFNLLTVLNATTKKEPDMWSRHYKALKKALPDTIDTLEDLDQLNLPPERREIVLDILRSGHPIPGWEKLQLKLLHEDAKNNENNNNQNKAA